MISVSGKKAVVAAGVAAAVLLAGCSSGVARSGEKDSPSITARGIGRVTGIPDTVVVTLGVESQGAEASQALSGNNERTNALIEILKQAGVAEEDIRTSQFSIFPRYDNEGRSITGYMVTNLLTARVSDSTDAGAIIDAAAAAAGNDVRVQSVMFEIDDKGSLYADARADAVAQARAQARQLADAAGVDLGGVRSIIESSISSPPIPFPMPRTDAFSAEAGVPLQPGSEELTLEVEVIFEIK